MKLYLSSYKIGNRIDELKKWINEHGNRICLIPNSRDIYPDSQRKSNGIQADEKELTDLELMFQLFHLKNNLTIKEKCLIE